MNKIIEEIKDKIVQINAFDLFGTKYWMFLLDDGTVRLVEAESDELFKVLLKKCWMNSFKSTKEESN